ncbi:unnamed protein product, partial [Rotaria sordida]
MTITQSYNLYCLNRGQPATNIESTYIYWQAMDGDMMLTITNEKIDPDGKDQPNLQCLICYVAGKPSTTTEDYREEYSYLNIDSPYHHSHNVHSYIHISAGDQDVPIRNLTINHEPVEELHPTFDKEFKLDTSALIKEHRASFHDVGSMDHKVKILHTPDVTSKPPMKRAASTTDLRKKAVDPTPIEIPRPGKRGFLGRLKYVFFGPTKHDDDPRIQSSPSELHEDYIPKSDSSSYNPSKLESPLPKPRKSHSPPSKPSKPDSSGSKPLKANPPPLISSTLPPCQDSIYCLLHNDKDHIDKHSHPCRFNELCRNPSSEPHLIHKRLDISMCLEDRSCSERLNPVHRAEYRHSGLPDYLLPCRFQETCYDKTPDHRMKYFHGEKIPLIKKISTSASLRAAVALKVKLTPCKFGNECRSMKNPEHTA